MRRHVLFLCIVLALLGSAAILTATQPGGVQAASRDVVLHALPITLGGWTGVDAVPDHVLPTDPAAVYELARTYRKSTDVLWLSVGYYPDQKQGRRPSARALLFPGRGWSTLSEHSITIPLDGPTAPSLHATMVVKTTPADRTAVLYWYQLGDVSVASDHWYRARVLLHRVIYGRADGALVRIAWPLSPADQPVTARNQPDDFVRVLYPDLLRTLIRPSTASGG